VDRLRAFEMFATVVAKGGFTRAAEAMGTSPANVTRYVNELEAHLGTRLLNRTSRKLSLTQSGEALYERCRSILEEVAEAEAIASSSAVAPRGRLRINAPLSFGVRHLAPLWPTFLARHPEVELDIALIDRVVDIVEEGYDLAIRISRAGSASHVGRKLATSRNIVCASPAYVAAHGAPTMPSQLKDHACIGYAYAATADDWRFTDGEGKAHAVKVEPRVRSNNGDTAQALALGGQGITWQPTFLVGEDLKAGRLVRLMPGYEMAPIDILAVYPSRRHVPAKVRAMIDFLAETFRGEPVWDQGLEV